MDEDVSEENFEGSAILVIRIPQAIYSKRPVYLTQNPFGHTYVRRHEGDYLVDDDEVRRMFADSNIKDYPLDAKVLLLRRTSTRRPFASTGNFMITATPDIPGRNSQTLNSSRR